ncbi:MAG: helix-turn-helix domain-containing protein [Thermoflexibacter sp.]|jgi:transcriptional regulator with XRE-family HTH domain|nr:helix-turn-helix domain-containing protein [Thermoflexibacter sp.]
MKEVLENIRRIRLEKRFKTKELAEKLGMTPPNYASIEAGRVPLTVERLKEIAIILEVDYKELLNGSATANNGEKENSEEIKNKYEKEILRLKKEVKQLEKLLKLTEKNHFRFQIDYTVVDYNFKIFSYVLMELIKQKPDLQDIILEKLHSFYKGDEAVFNKGLEKKFSKENLITVLQEDIDNVANIYDRYADEISENIDKDYWAKKKPITIEF